MMSSIDDGQCPSVVDQQRDLTRVVWVAVAALLVGPPALADVTFKKQTLTERFVAEGCDMADFDKDGHVDITAGNTIWHGPEFSRQTEFTPPADNPSGPTKTPYDPTKGYSDYFLAYAYDFTGDSWPDILVYGLPGEAAHMFVNPQGKPGHWEKHAIFDVADGDSGVGTQVTVGRLDADAKPDVIVANKRGVFVFFQQ